MSSWHGGWLSARENNPKKQGGSHNAFYDLVLEVILLCHIRNILLVTQVTLGEWGRRATQACAGITGSFCRLAITKGLICFKTKNFLRLTILKLKT